MVQGHKYMISSEDQTPYNSKGLLDKFAKHCSLSVQKNARHIFLYIEKEFGWNSDGRERTFSIVESWIAGLL